MLGRSTKKEIIIELAFVIWPLNSHDINIPYTIRVTQNFRVITVITMDIFWEILGILLGSFWDKPNPMKQPDLLQRDNSNTVRLPVNKL